MEERFAEGDTILHRMDPTPKIISALIFIVPAATTSSFYTGALFLLFSLVLASLSRLPFKSIIKRLAVVNTFTLFLLLTLPLTYGGEQIPLFSWLTISREGARTALLILLKTNSVLIAMISLLSTSTIASLGHGMQRIGIPVRFCHLVLFSYRYVFVIEQEFRRLQRAAKMRSFIPGTSLHTYRTYGYLFGMTLVKSWDRAQRVHHAMTLRGFNGRFLSLYAPRRIPMEGYLLMCCTLMFCTGLFCWEHTALYLFC